MEFAMVLSGGGAKGAYQVGAFRALAEYDITVKAVSGSSIGGINGYAYATLPLERIEQLWTSFQMSDFISLDDDWSDGLSDRASLENILDDIVTDSALVGKMDVYNTICTDSTNAEYIKLNDLDRDAIKKVILATSALPVIYSKVEINGVCYQDGGVADNLPVKPLHDAGYRNILVITLSKDLRVDRYYYPTDNLIEIYPSKDLGDLLDGTMNFSKEYISYAMKLGYADAKRTLNEYFGIDNGCHTVDYDYEQINHELNQESIQRDIDRNMDGIMKYML